MADEVAARLQIVAPEPIDFLGNAVQLSPTLLHLVDGAALVGAERIREAVDLGRSKRAKKGGGQADQQNAQSERNNKNQRLSPVGLSHRMSLPAMPLPDWSPGCTAGIDLDQSCFLWVTTYVFGTLGGAMSFRTELFVFSLLLTVVAPSEGYAVCYCSCTTTSGNTCTVSVPDFACNGTGNSRCTGPTEPCRYDCSRTGARPSSCGRLRRCSVRN